MRLSRKIDQAIICTIFIALAVGMACFLRVHSVSTFAEGEEGVTEVIGAKFVTFYDEGKKLGVRTDAKTVGEALARANIVLNDGDIVEPGLDTEINADNYFINIYRARPVIVKDGITEKYLMTASYDYKTIAREAGMTVYDGDEVKLMVNQNFLEVGGANLYQIKRNGGRTLTEEVEIPFTERKTKDYNLAPGVEEVRQLGEVGTKKLTYNVKYVDGVEVERTLMGEEVVREPVERIVAVGASAIEKNALTASKGVNIYTVNINGKVIERKETYYDLPMSGVMRACGGGNYSVRADGAKVDGNGYVLVAANLSRYPRCSVVETSLGPGKVYDTGGFAAKNPEQFDLATDWSNHDGR
ncbi:G5 domain-containing protein [Candidatus Saccharibacteria bacterium]|nr:G5 domain-containing protein [Candidatus Saccharibacteria bacterium]MBR2741521.1 G5 domain-containing protein [Candidatus Saccharibacteria bacterium]